MRLGDVLRLRKEVVHPRDNPSGRATFVGLEHIDSGTGKRNGSVEIDLTALTGRKPRFYQNDIVYGYLRPYLNKVWLAEFNGLCSVDQYVYCVAAERADPEFIAWFMRSPDFLERAPIDSTPGQLPRIRTEEVASVPIILPPIAEQRRIAGRLANQLESVARVRTAAEGELEAARGLSAAYLRSFFDTPAAQGWPTQRLGNVCSLLPSKSIASDGDAEVLAITTACLSEDGFLPRGIKQARMYAKDAAQCVATRGEILIARSNTPELVGRASLFDGEPRGVVASDLTVRILPGPSFVPTFLSAYLSSLFLTGFWKETAGGASGSMKKITRSQIESLLVPCPIIAEQSRISSSLAVRKDASSRIAANLKERRDAIDQLPAALLRRAFQGEL